MVTHRAVGARFIAPVKGGRNESFNNNGRNNCFLIHLHPTLKMQFCARSQFSAQSRNLGNLHDMIFPSFGLQANESYEGIIAAWMEGMAFADPHKGHSDPFQDPVSLDGLAGIG